MGYHRFYSHRAYRLNKLVELVLLFFGAMAIEGSVLRWSFDHRQHHRFVDTDKDPYSINKGFWYAHVLWLFEKQQPVDEKVVPDLVKNKLVMFQDKYYGILMALTNGLVILILGFIFNDFFGAFVFGFLLRIFLLHHCTWFINSLAHYWGSRTYSKEFSAVDNYIIALLTFGEGYHNYHHVFSSDYRNGVRWYHFDPSKWLLWSLSKIGLAQQLTKTNAHTIKRRLVQEDRNLVLDKIKRILYVNKEALEAKVHEFSERISVRITSINQIKEKFKQGEKLATLQEIKRQKKILRADWRAWCKLVKGIMRLPYA